MIPGEEAAGGRCLRCSGSAPNEELAKRRTPTNAFARAAEALAVALCGYPHALVDALLPSACRREGNTIALPTIAASPSVRAIALDVVRAAVDELGAADHRDGLHRAIALLALAVADDALTREMIDIALGAGTIRDASARRDLALDLALTMAPGEGMVAAVEHIAARSPLAQRAPCGPAWGGPARGMRGDASLLVTALESLVCLARWRLPAPPKEGAA